MKALARAGFSYIASKSTRGQQSTGVEDAFVRGWGGVGGEYNALCVPAVRDPVGSNAIAGEACCCVCRHGEEKLLKRDKHTTS